MHTVTLGNSPLQVTPICLGTMTFGEQVNTELAHRILDRSLERGVNFIDTAEMYAVPAKAETYGATETIIGQWFASRPGVRQKVVLATKVAGPSRGMPWIRGEQSGLTRSEIIAACEGSLRRLGILTQAGEVGQARLIFGLELGEVGIEPVCGQFRAGRNPGGLLRRMCCQSG